MAHVLKAGGALHWSQCDCGMKFLELSHRSGWMRLFFPDRRLYFCRTCRQRMLIPMPLLRRPR